MRIAPDATSLRSRMGQVGLGQDINVGFNMSMIMSFFISTSFAPANICWMLDVGCWMLGLVIMAPLGAY